MNIKLMVQQASTLVILRIELPCSGAQCATIWMLTEIYRTRSVMIRSKYTSWEQTPYEFPAKIQKNRYIQKYTKPRKYTRGPGRERPQGRTLFFCLIYVHQYSHTCCTFFSTPPIWSLYVYLSPSLPTLSFICALYTNLVNLVSSIYVTKPTQHSFPYLVTTSTLTSHRSLITLFLILSVLQGYSINTS